MSDKREPHRGVVVKTSADDAAVQLERLISKQKYKDAVKQAKLIHKAEATPQSHRQLEWAYFLRAQQLLRAGMPASAVEVSRHLLDFGVTDAKLVGDFSPLLVKLGLAQDAFRIQGRLESPESQSRLLLLVADQTVLHPERPQPCSPEVGQESALVRQALEALYAADEATALGLVRDIARSSPVSEWKLLVRGLAAFYRGDHGETQANWSRLDPERAPQRIARHLQKLQQGQSEKDAIGTDFAELEGLVYGERILPRLRELATLSPRIAGSTSYGESHRSGSASGQWTPDLPKSSPPACLHRCLNMRPLSTTPREPGCSGSSPRWPSRWPSTPAGIVSGP